jgi:hypothetical protein
MIYQLRDVITFDGHTKINEYFRYCADDVEPKI